MTSGVPPPAPFDERAKHLEFLQATITRLGTNSFLIKGWTMTLSAALVALAARDSDWVPCVTALVLTLGFWALDTYYLGRERQFRSLYEKAGTPATTIPLYTMDADTYGDPVHWAGVAVSPTLLLFHGVVTLLVSAVTAVLVST